MERGRKVDREGERVGQRDGGTVTCQQVQCIHVLVCILNYHTNA